MDLALLWAYVAGWTTWPTSQETVDTAGGVGWDGMGRVDWGQAGWDKWGGINGMGWGGWHGSGRVGWGGVGGKMRASNLA